MDIKTPYITSKPLRYIISSNFQAAPVDFLSLFYPFCTVEGLIKQTAKYRHHGFCFGSR